MILETESLNLVKVLNKDPNASEPIEYEIDVSSSKLLQYYSGRSLSNDEKRDFCITERLIDQYFIIVQKSIKDKVPKAIMNFTVNYVIAHLQSELITALYDQTNVDELLVENGNMTQRRKETAEMLKALNKAK
uniref:GED domain-containing protein n=1 Tax=Panagrolaimus sp. ES5 TaxID=591445 RepID=A0AC34FY92_9BILA